MGAVTLAAKACLRVGAGKVTSLIPKFGYNIIQTAVPEAMVVCDASENELTHFYLTEDFQAIGIGVGLGTHKTTAEGFEKFLKTCNLPLVLDADAINLLSKNKKLLDLLPKKSILTPHPGELERLVGSWKNDFDKLAKVKKLSKKYDVIVVIKGANTITVYQDSLFINTNGNPGMASAGSGDVLTGMLTGFISQGYDPLISAIFGVYLHASAGDIAAQHLGYNSIIAGDLIEFLGDAFLELFRKEAQPDT